MKKKVVFALMDYQNENKRIHISKFILDTGNIPVYPQVVGDFFTTVPLNRTAGDLHNSIRRADEVWIFGQEDNKMKENIEVAIKLRKPIKYFQITGNIIKEINK